MAEDVTPVVTDQTSQQVHIEEPAVPTPTDTAESLGIDQASYDKYYKDGNFDWASYGKEQAFKAQQQAKPMDAEPGTTQDAPTEGAEKAVEQAGLNWEDLGARVVETGDISPEDYTALADIGIPEQVVKDYIQAVQSNAQSVIDSVIDGFGGQEAFDSVYAALYENTSLDQRNKIDSLLRDPDTREAGIVQSYRLAGMQPPTAGEQVQQQAQPQASRANAAPATQAAQGYSSFDEQVAAQRDPRYHSDAAYRAEVMAKIEASTWTHNPRTGGAGL